MIKLVDKTLTTAVIEVLMDDIAKDGFDYIWDMIRKHYPEKDYVLEDIKRCHNGKILLITMRTLKYPGLLDN